MIGFANVWTGMMLSIVVGNVVSWLMALEPHGLTTQKLNNLKSFQ